MAVSRTKLSVVNATIRTATIQIKTLTLNNKQLTLSAFRQLPQRDLYMPHSGIRRGTPWGRVNYFWGQCEPDHLHIVWQDRDELCRACVFSSYPGRQYYQELVTPRVKDHLLLKILAGWEPDWEYSTYGDTPLSMTCTRYGKKFDVLITRDEMRAFQHLRRASYLPEESSTDKEKRLSQARNAIYTHLFATYAWSYLTDEDYFSAILLQSPLEAWTQGERHWIDEYQEIKELDQLFIAV
jgi:hypothetical protein